MKINTSATGAALEMFVAAELLLLGFEVFRSTSPASPCDLVVLSANGQPCRIQVRSAKRNVTSGMLSFGYTTAEHSRFDVLALFIESERRTIYAPDPAAWFNGERVSSEFVLRLRNKKRAGRIEDEMSLDDDSAPPPLNELTSTRPTAPGRPQNAKAGQP